VSSRTGEDDSESSDSDDEGANQNGDEGANQNSESSDEDDDDNTQNELRSNHVMHFGRDSDHESSQIVLVGRSSRSPVRTCTLRNPETSKTPKPRHFEQTEKNTEFLNNFLASQLNNRPSKSGITIAKKRKRVVGPSGACITSQESEALMQDEENQKLQKKIDTDRLKKQRESKRRKMDEEATRKKELKSIKKINKAREICECLKERKNDKANKNRWLDCFDCGKWCCTDCLPMSSRPHAPRSTDVKSVL